MKKLIHILTILTCFYNTSSSQTTITLNQPEVANGNISHVANTSVTFQEGYHYSPLTATSIHAYINESVTGNTPAGGVFSGGLGGGFDDREINTSLEVGTISGSHGVSPTGAATYSIPLKLAPGTNGRAPSLSVNYNSQQGNGILGMGWSLGGLSLITRVPKTIYHNSIVEPVMIDNYTIPSGTLTDDYAIDGNRLMNLSGSYGSDGTIYGTENETFNKITSNGQTGNGPSWFKVETKDGLTLEYGNTTDSKLLPSIQKTSVMVWYLNKVTDNYGNVYNYTYRLENNEILIDKIEYGNSQEVFNSIQFIYDLRNDNNTIYLSNEQVKQNVVLSQIKITADGALSRKYEFKHGYNIYTYLTEIIEYGSNGASLNSTIFKYGEVNNEITIETNASGLTPSNSNASNSEFWSGDFNGDGKSDLIGLSYAVVHNDPEDINFPPVERHWQDIDLFINDGNNQFIKTGNIPLPPNFSNYGEFSLKKRGQIGNTNLQNIDFNGDGLSDILFIIPSGNNQIIYPYLSNGTTFLAQPSIEITTALSGSFFSRTLDVDGDGKTEIFITYNTGPQSFTYELIFNLNRLDPKSCFKSYNALFTTQLAGYLPPRPTETGPLAPICHYEPNGFLNCSTNPAYIAAVLSWQNSNPQPNYIPGSFQGIEFDFSKSYVVDYDGDGKYELDNVIRMYTNSNGTKKSIVMNYNGTCFSEIEHQSVFEVEENTSVKDQLIGDFNGDHISDKIFTKMKYPWLGWDCRYYNSAEYFEVNGNNQLLSPYMDPLSPLTINPVVENYVGDINGDRKSDIIEFESINNINVHYSNGLSFIKKSYPLTIPVDYKNEELVFGDFNGDDKLDIMVYERTNTPNFRFIYFEKNSKELLLHGVKDGFNNTTEITYDYLTNNDVYTKGSTSNYPLVDVQIPIPVVTGVKTPNGVGGDNITTYKYEETKLNKHGKGLLGFKKTISENNTSNTRTTVEYEIDNTFITPHLKKVNTALISPSQPLAEMEYSYDYLNLGNKRYLKTVNQFVQKNLLNNLITTTDYTYDNFGNVEQTIINKGSIETIITNDLYQPYGNWGAKNRLISSQTSISRPGSGTPPNVRSSTFTYNTEGSLETKTDDNGVLTTLDYNGFGNIEKSTVSGAAIRVTEFTYDSKGRFVLDTKNPLDQYSHATYDGRWGVPLTQTGVDGLTTTFQYDEFGRLLKTTTPDNITTETTLTWEIGGGGATNPISADNSIYTSTTTSTGSSSQKVWYDSFGRPRKNTVDGFDNAINQVTTYDARGNVATTTTPFFAADVPKITTYTYDDYNFNNSILNDVSTTTIIRNLSTGTTTTTLTPSNGIGNPTTSTTVTDPTGKIISVTDAGGTLTYTYYSSGLQKDIKLDGALVASMEYDNDGNQTKLTDPNAGETTYEYNSFGELTKQTDAKNNVFEMTYDVIGRVQAKTENGNSNFTTSYTYYDMVGDNGLNQLKSTTYNGITQNFTYDYLGRITETKETFEGEDYIFAYQYDNLNRVEQTTYPSGFITKHNYNGFSYPTSITDDQSIPYWQVGTSGMNAYNKYTSYSLGNGQTTIKTYDEYGLITSVVTSNPNIQNLVLNFNPVNGNLMSRENPTKNLLEEFTYDNLNRLTETKVNSILQHSMQYQPNGNIGFKTDVGNYSYDANRKNAVTQVSNPLGVISTNNQNTTDYTPFNSISTIIENNNELTFTYGADHQRRKMEHKIGGNIQKTTYYFGNYEKIEFANGDVTELNYIAGGDGLVAIHVIITPSNQQPVASTYYTYTDHLGSILTLTNNVGDRVFEQNFDAWGRTRNVADWTYDNINIDAVPFVEIGYESIVTWLTRGYTGHEHLPQLSGAGSSLINMNGRLYDPILGRMLSPDNHVQSPFNSQSYNRYSYVINNPLKYIDPSGESWLGDLWDGVVDAWNGLWDYLNGTPNPETGQMEGGLAQKIPEWVPDFSVGVNSSGQTYHTVGNSAPIYHNSGNSTIPGINWGEVYVVDNTVGGMPTTGLYGEPINLGGFEPSMNDQGGEDEGAAAILAGGWGVALFEPTPIGEAVMGLATAGAALYYGPGIIDKMNKEIEGIKQRVSGPQGFVYELRATRNAPYPNLNSNGTTTLNIGDVWKYGQTTQGFGRYSGSFYETRGLEMVPIFPGNQVEILIQEKIMIYGYFLMNGHRPPGNPIFR